MREENEAIAELIGVLHRLVDVCEYLVQSPEGEEPLPEEKTEAPTLEEVRAVLANLSAAGHSSAVKALIAKFGANKLSDIVPEQYAALLKEAERIGT